MKIVPYVSYASYLSYVSYVSIASLYLMYLDTDNSYGWAMCQILPLNVFKWERNTSKFKTS